MLFKASSYTFRLLFCDRNQERVIDQRLKRRIYVDTQYSSFVQCVSPMYQDFREMVIFLCTLDISPTLPPGVMILSPT